MLNWFGNKPQAQSPRASSGETAKGAHDSSESNSNTRKAPASRPSLPPIVVYDKEGKPFTLERSVFAAKVLPKEFEAAFNDPERLYGAVVTALNDQFFFEALAPAQRLLEIDPRKERATTILGIALLKTGKLEEAGKLLSEFLVREKSGVVMTNLAKVRAEQGKKSEANKLLREALSVDPNMDNALEWYVAIARDERGESGYLDALRQIAREPGSWRAQLWLARDFLRHGDSQGALQIYRQVLASKLIPGDGLMMITGDLGNHGLIKEMVELILPIYDENRHDILAGRNLLQACVELGLKSKGLELCDRLLKLERFDYKVWLDAQRAALDAMES
jgi:tetratricopeptide (TPR) repeat protein